MNLSTEYLGLKLAHPLITGASPLVDNLDTVRRLEDAGAAALTMHSLFEEQILQEMTFEEVHRQSHEESSAEAASYFPGRSEFVLGPDQYLEQIQRIKAAVSIPLIASLNGTHLGSWIDYSSLIEKAGADALELNIYFLPTDPSESGEDVERRVVDIVRAVRESVSLPVAVKLSPYFSSLCHFASELDVLGVNGLVLFNRFYQPDIDIENLEVVPHLELSDSHELRLRLRWLAILSEQVKCSLAVSGGVHTVEDIIKSVMAGASAVQTVSALLHHGPRHIRTLLTGLQEWLEEHEYLSLQQMLGSMNLRTCPNPEAFERANYLRTLQIWRS
ncbi:MAG: dihydroorotate dehydrogenase-like protein [Opitutales bacterium]